MYGPIDDMELLALKMSDMLVLLVDCLNMLICSRVETVA